MGEDIFSRYFFPYCLRHEKESDQTENLYPLTSNLYPVLRNTPEA